jgi:hypothetical protein
MWTCFTIRPTGLQVSNTSKFSQRLDEYKDEEKMSSNFDELALWKEPSIQMSSGAGAWNGRDYFPLLSEMPIG